MSSEPVLKRGLSEEFLDALDELAKGPSWWRDVLDHEDTRIAVRDGYLNVYCDGQSIFKVEFDRKTGTVRPSIHFKYLIRPSLADDDSGSGGEYVSLKGDDFDIGTRNLGHFIHTGYRAGTDGTLGDLIRTAKRFAGDEKKYVDDIVKRDPNVIDMEIAVQNTNCRIDLACIEPRKGAAALVFYEVKLRANRELNVPKSVPKNNHKLYLQAQNPADGEDNGDDERKERGIVVQMMKYDQMLADVDLNDVAKSYQKAAHDLRRLLARCEWRRAKLGRSINDVADGTIALTVDPKVRLIITGFDGDQKSGKSFNTLLGGLNRLFEGRIYYRGSYGNDFATLARTRPYPR